MLLSIQLNKNRVKKYFNYSGIKNANKLINNSTVIIKRIIKPKI